MMYIGVGLFVGSVVLFVIAAVLYMRAQSRRVIETMPAVTCTVQAAPLSLMEPPRSTTSGDQVPNTAIAPPQPPVFPVDNPRYPLRGTDYGFQQVGVLVSQDANQDETLFLPLFGRKMTHRDRWEYFVASDRYHMWRIPVEQKNRMCDDDVGCDEIFNGDEVVVPDYAGKTFVARIYKYRSQVVA